MLVGPNNARNKVKNYYFNRPVQEFSNNNNLALDRKIKYICDGLTPRYAALVFGVAKG